MITQRLNSEILLKIDSTIAGLLNRRKNKVEKKFPRNL